MTYIVHNGRHIPYLDCIILAPTCNKAAVKPNVKTSTHQYICNIPENLSSMVTVLHLPINIYW